MSVLDKPFSRVTEISKVESLAAELEISKSDLIYISNNIEKFYKPGKLLHKKNGEPRPTHDAKPRLKRIHELIKNKLLKRAYYPRYMQGGIADSVNPRNCSTHAAIHSGKVILISEDIADFYPSTTTKVVHSIWQGFFKFPPVIAELLTKLTTYQGYLPQGWKTSGYLANLAFWKHEALLVQNLQSKGYSYSRYMDDISVSSSSQIPTKEKTEIVKSIYRMLLQSSFRPKRTKHEIKSASGQMTVTGLLVNAGQPGLPKSERRLIRASLHRLSERALTERKTDEYQKSWRSLSGKIARLRKYHPAEGDALRQKLNLIKQ